MVKPHLGLPLSVANLRACPMESTTLAASGWLPPPRPGLALAPSSKTTVFQSRSAGSVTADVTRIEIVIESALIGIVTPPSVAGGLPGPAGPFPRAKGRRKAGRAMETT